MEIVDVNGLKSREKSLEEKNEKNNSQNMGACIKIQNYKNEEHPLGIDTGYLVKSTMIQKNSYC